jgi:integrase
MQMKLTLRRIETLQCPPGKKDVLVFDLDQAGLGVRVTQSGGKSYLAQYRNADGLKRRIPLGSCSALSLADARVAVRAIMGDVAKGGDPAAERTASKQKALTLGDLLGQWQRLYLVHKRPRYAESATRALRRVFARHLDEPATAMRRDIVVRILDGLAKDGKAAMATATARYGSALFGWATRRGSLSSSNPFERVPTAPTVRRDRVLSDEEIRLIWIATEEPGTFNAIVRVLILTGQRRDEVAGMTWGEIAPDLSVWTIPAARAKNGVAHLVPLSEQTQGLLRSQSDGLVFPGLRGPFNGFSKAKDALDKASGVRGWRLHDLRRTVATGLQKLGVRLEVTEAILNHVSGSRTGIVGVYQRHDWAVEKRLALSAWGAHVAAIVEKREAPDNVTPLSRTA